MQIRSALGPSGYRACFRPYQACRDVQGERGGSVLTKMSTLCTSWCRNVRTTPAKRFFRKMMNQAPDGRVPMRLGVMGQLEWRRCRSLCAATTVTANSRAQAHQHTRQHERQMKRFRLPGQARPSVSVRSQVHNLCVARHRMRDTHCRVFRARAFGWWRDATRAEKAA